MKDSSKTKAQLLAELEALHQRAADCEARAAQRAAELAIVNSVQQGLAAHLDMQSIYDLVGEKIREIFDAQVVLLVSFEHATRLTHYHYAIEKGQRGHIPPTPFGLLAEHVIRTRQPMLLNRAGQFAAFDVQVVPGTERARAILNVPLIVGDQVTGGISLQNLDRADAFDDPDVRLLQTLAASMSVALENARLFDETQRLLQETEQRAAELAIINSVGEAMAKNLDVQTVARIVGEKVRDIFKAEVTEILLLDPTAQHIHSVYSYDRGYSERETAFPLGQGLTSIIIQSRKPLVLGTYQAADALGAINVPNASGDEAQPESYLGVPIIVGEKVLGVVSVQSYRQNAYDEDSVRLLSTLSANMGVAIENARLFQEANRLLKETEQRAAELAVINSVQAGLASKLDLQAIYELVGDKIREIFDAQSVSIVTYERNTDVACFRYLIERGTRIAVPPRPMGERGFTPLVMRTRQPLLINRDMQQRAAEAGSVVVAGDLSRSALYVPLIVSDEAKGVISLQNLDRENAFTESDVRLLTTLANSMSVALENARLFDETQRLLKESEQRATELAIINEIQQGLASKLDFQAIIDLVGDRISEIFGAVDTRICLYDRTNRMLRTLYEVAEGVREPEWVRPLGDGLTSRVIETRQPLIFGTMEEAIAQGAIVRFVGVDKSDEQDLNSGLMVPLLAGDEVTGVVSVQRLEPHAYTENDLRLLQTLAASLSVALENARLYVEADRRAGQMATLAEAGREISASHDLPAIMESITRRAHEICRARTTVLRLADGDEQSYRTAVALGQYADQFKSDVIRPGQGITGAIVVSGIPEIIPDPRKDPRATHVQGTPEEEEQPETLMVAPLVVRGQTVGVLTLYRWVVEGQFSPVDLDFLSGLARQAAIAIENVRLLEAAQESQRRMADIIDFLPDATLVVDREGKVIAWNRAIEEMTGVKAADMLGKGNYEYSLPFYGEHRPILIDLVLRPYEEIEKKYAHIKQHGAILVGEAVVPLLQGQPAYLYATASPLRNSKGEIAGAIETIRDISDRKRAEQELRQAQAEAEAARQQAEAANAAKSAFLATMSHEIRTPMNGIIGMTGLLLDTSLTPDQLEFAQTIRSSGETLLTIINDILDFSKIESRKMELESQPFNLRDCLESALDLVATTAAEKKLDLAYVIEDGVPAAIVGDVTRVRQILLNLLSNAVKFTEQGEVVVTVTGVSAPTPPHSHPMYGGVGVWELHFSVRDTGIGIPLDRLDRLFRAFTQVDASTSRKYGGTGLGLAISKRLSEMMGGRLWVESTGLPGPQGGSTFHFTLLAEAAPETLREPRACLIGEQPQLRGRRMLIVDDNLTNRRILTLQARLWGMLARDTASPAEALCWIRQGDPFDVAILDMHMPEMDGVALAAEIRRSRDACALPLILFSSLGRREAGDDRETFAAYLTKPLKQSQLFDALARLFAEGSLPTPVAASARSRVDPEMAARLPLRILLAEDNTVNQKLALRFLAQMGYRADVAANGLEALQAVERQRYDVVLMDVQMPEMDGLEASRRLCARWPPPERPCIIAMTANAMQGDREMCLAAGMDDYLAKPIRIEELAGALSQAQPRGEIGAKHETPAEVLDRTTLDNLAATADAGFVRELINAFLEDSPQLLSEMCRALADGNADAFRRAAHSLKSNGASLGALGLAALAKRLELKGKAGDLTGVNAGVEQLVAEYDRVERALRDWRHEA